MKVKDGVIFINPRPSILHAMEVVDIYWRHVLKRQAVITAGRDGVHSEGSLHYGTLEDIREAAFDVRTRDLDGAQKAKARLDLKRLLGETFDVVLEDTHLHIEYDFDLGDLTR